MEIVPATRVIIRSVNNDHTFIGTVLSAKSAALKTPCYHIKSKSTVPCADSVQRYL